MKVFLFLFNMTYYDFNFQGFLKKSPHSQYILMHLHYNKESVGEILFTVLISQI